MNRMGGISNLGNTFLKQELKKTGENVGEGEENAFK